MRGRITAIGRDRGGAVAFLTALCMMALVGCAALAVDLGHVFLRSRQLQGVADLAALAAVQALGSTDGATPAAAASGTAALNPWPGGVQTLAVQGVYVADAATPASQRFTAGSSTPNAVKVTLRAPVALYFAGVVTGRSTLEVTRTATAARAQYAAFSIGSGLAAFDGGVANAVLSALTGSQVSLAAVDYRSLASAQVDLLRYLPALQARAGLTGMSYGQTLSASVAPPAVLNALADTLQASGQTGAAAAARSLAAASAAQAPTPLGNLLDLGPYAAQDHALDAGGAAVEVGALDLAEAALASANGGRQLSLSLNGATPGVAQLSATLAIGQRPNHSPWLTVTDGGQVVVRTTQMRLYLQAGLSPGPLALATGGALIQLPVYVEAASAQAKLQDISCPATAANQALDLSVSPSLGTLAVAQADTSALANFGVATPLQTATLLNAVLLKATAYGREDLGGGQASWQPVHFTAADVAAGTVKSVTTSDIARATVASLLSSTTLAVQTPGGGVLLTPATVSPVLQGLLKGAAPSLDAVIAEVEAVSGARLGEADVRADGLRCHGVALVA